MIHLPAPEHRGTHYPWLFADVRFGTLELLTPHAGGTSPYRERVRDWLDDRAYAIGPKRKGEQGMFGTRMKGLPVPREELASERYWIAVDDPVDPVAIILIPARTKSPQIVGGDGLLFEQLFVHFELATLERNGKDRWANVPEVFIQPLLHHVLGSGRGVANRPAVFIQTDGLNIFYTTAGYWKQGETVPGTLIHDTETE